MKCEWKKCLLGDLITFQRGYDLPKASMIDGDYPVVGSNGIIGFHNKYTTEAPSITVGRSGNVGNPFIVYSRTWSHNTTLYIKEFKNCDPCFIYYYLKTLDLANYSGGSAVPTLNRNHIHTLPVCVPENIDYQRKISRFLKFLDDKIELNQKINDNLERQADAIYQTYFSPKSGNQGEIATLDKYCYIFTGKKNANESVDGGKYKFFTCSPEALQIDSYIYDGNAIIVSGNGAYTGRTRFYSGKFDLYQRTYACTLLDGIDPDYIFPLYWFVKLELSKKIMGGTRGSAIPYIVMNDLSKFEFVYNEKTFAEYLPVFKVLTETIQANEVETEKLAETRDTLLPRLMSGELDVSNLEI